MNTQVLSPLFEKFELGDLILSNRVVMAPMTRARAPQRAASEETARYYTQRATAGLIVSEGIPVSHEAEGYIHLPGVSSPEQIQGWKTVTDAVHAAGGVIFAQLWHVGRVSHHSLQPAGQAPVSSSTKQAANTNAFALQADGTAGFVQSSQPRALPTDEVPRVVADFRAAAINAIEAGFDGIEIHGATGYLFEQFLNPNVNDRADRYGGSIENRARLLLETVTAIADAIEPDRTAVRLSPHAELFDHAPYAEAEDTYMYLADALSGQGLAYVHLHELGWTAGRTLLSEQLLEAFKSSFAGPVMLTGGLTKEVAADYLRRDLVDLVGFGRPFLANPDLVDRFRDDWPLAEADQSTFYGGGSEGYTDYKTYTELPGGAR